MSFRINLGLQVLLRLELRRPFYDFYQLFFQVPIYSEMFGRILQRCFAVKL